MSFRQTLFAAAALALASCAAGSAQAYDRGVTVTTPSGTYTKTVDASCADHHCTRDASVTGPNGGTVSRDTQCGASWRFYRCTGTVTGPNGNSVSRRVVGRRW